MIRKAVSSTLELSFKIRVDEFSKLMAILHVERSISPLCSQLGEGWSLCFRPLVIDNVDEVMSDVVIRDGLLAEN